MVPPEARESLWTLLWGPTLWLLHFLVSYATAAIYCARHGAADDEIGPVTLAVAAYTVVALVLILLGAHRGFGRHRYGEDAAPPHDADTAEDRHRFLGYASLLLCGLSAIATVFVAMAVVFAGSCR